MNFIPKNRYLLVELQEQKDKKEKSTVLVPDGYVISQPGYAVAKVIKTSCDTNHTPIVKDGDIAIINRGMIEELEVGAEKYSIVLENYVLGILK